MCRHHIDTFESWSRRLIDERFKEKYSNDYFEHEITDGQPLIKSEIKKRIESRVDADPKRFPRKIDAILIEDIEYFFCRDDLYASSFKQVLEPFFSGKDEIRSVLNRVIQIRNKVSHGGTISHHEAEQCICYTNDFVDVFKAYYQKLGKAKDYNVPVFIRIKDCFGNDIIRNNSQSFWEVYLWGNNDPHVQLRSGDEYKLWVEVDSSFDSSLYKIHWHVQQLSFDRIADGSGNEIRFTVKNNDVSYSPEIIIYLTTTKEWHRFGKFDDYIKILLGKVLPPIEDTY